MKFGNKCRFESAEKAGWRRIRGSCLRERQTASQLDKFFRPSATFNLVISHVAGCSAADGAETNRIARANRFSSSMTKLHRSTIAYLKLVDVATNCTWVSIAFSSCTSLKAHMFYRSERFVLLANTSDFIFLFYVRGLLIYSRNWFSAGQKFTSMDAISIPAMLFLCGALYFHEIELLVVVLGCSKNL